MTKQKMTDAQKGELLQYALISAETELRLSRVTGLLELSTAFEGVSRESVVACLNNWIADASACASHNFPGPFGEKTITLSLTHCEDAR